jgi:3-methyladenine DNA glycosylase AlkD
MNEIEHIRKKLVELGNKERSEHGKKYLSSPYNLYGNKIPDVRAVSNEFKKLDFYSALNLVDELWNSGNHEEMWIALHLLTFHLKKNPTEVWKFMMQRIEKAKTWDLTDELSAHVFGPILVDKINLMSEIKKLSESKNPWFRRISIVSNLNLIKKNKIELTLRLAEKLVYDDDVYVQKGVGWMLREVGKKNRLAAREFILMHIDMKPQAFSYATEKMIELRKIRKEKKIKKVRSV